MLYTANYSDSTNAHSSACCCNTTACPHWQEYRLVASQAVDADRLPPPKPRPWIAERVAVVPRFKGLGVPPWRPRQQRARDGI